MARGEVHLRAALVAANARRQRRCDLVLGSELEENMKRKKLNRLHWRAAASGVLLASMSCVSCKKDSTPTTQPSTPTPVASAPTVAAPATATAVTPAVPASTQKAGGPAPGPI